MPRAVGDTLRRVRRFLACALCVTTLACKSTSEFYPVTPTEVRRASLEISAGGHGSFTDRGGRAHSAEAAELYVRTLGRPEEPIATYAARCARDAACVDANASYELGGTKNVPDGQAIVGGSVLLSLTGLLVAGNVACFGTNVCADGTKVVVGVADGVVITAVVALVVALGVAFSHFRGD